MKYKLHYFGVAIAFMFLLACSNGSEKKNSNAQNQDVEPVVYAKEDIAEQYLNIKNALVASNADSAQIAAKSLVIGLENKKEAWANEMLPFVKLIADTMMLEVQRANFKTLSDELIKLANESNDFGISLYEQYCPMAFNNEGASWLSDKKEIRNPYYGDQMLK